MRLCFLSGISLLLAAGAWAGSRAANGAPVKVFLLAGQSNLAGRAPGEELAPDAMASAVMLDYVCSFGAATAEPGPPEPHRSGGWGPLQPAPKHASTPGTHFGPEIGFGRTLAARWPERRIAIIKHGRGATNLAEDWNPEATTGRQYYREFVAQARTVFERLRAEGTPFELAAFVWCQGNADSTRREWAEAYDANLRNLLARVRKDFDAPTLPVLVVLIGEGRNPRTAFAPAVRAAQRQVTAGDPHTVLVVADDLTLLDQAHYDAPSQLELGRRLAAAFLARSQP